MIFERLGRFVFRRRWLTLVLSGIFLVVSLVVLTQGGDLTGSTIHDIESERAQTVVEEVLGHTMDTTVVAIFRADAPPLKDPRNADFQDAMKEALAPIRKDPRVLSVMTADDAPPTLALAMVSPKAHSAFALITLKGTLKQALKSYRPVRTLLRSPLLTIECTGRLSYLGDLGVTLEHDLFRAELISLPLAVLVLLLVFRTSVAAVLPVGVGALAVMGGIALVLLLSRVTDVADYTVNVCSLIGLGVAIDYSLFTLSRYREELAQGRDYEDALVRAMGHAGRIVSFSGLAVGTGLAGLLFFERSYLFAVGIGGITVVTLAVIFALTFLPALLAVLGPRIHAGKLSIGKLGPREGFWNRTAIRVMAHPFLVLVPTVLLLLVMGVPFLHLRMSASDSRILNVEADARRGYDSFSRDFPDAAATRLVVAVEYPAGAPEKDRDPDVPALLTTTRIDALYDFSRKIATLPHVVKVESLVDGDTPMDKDDYESILLHPSPVSRDSVLAGEKMMVGAHAMLFYVVVDAPPETPEAQGVVVQLRALGHVGDGNVMVGGQTANDVDTTHFISSRTPRVITFIVVMTFLIFGALVWIFQDGHLGLAPARPVEPTIPVLLFCVLFGLSMDYEVLMLSRMKEVYDRTGDNTQAVAEGLEKTAGLITSAAAIMVVVFGAFALAQVVVVRAVGFGMGLAVALDATLIRVLLVPATMRLFGPLNWWAPKWMMALRKMTGLDKLAH